jgi:hypothetical protein
MIVNGCSNDTRLKTFDPNWVVLGYQPRDNAEDHREMLRDEGAAWMRLIATSGSGPSMGAPMLARRSGRPAIADRQGRIPDLRDSSRRRLFFAPIAVTQPQ